jgi:replication factor C subunit 2/4
VAIRYGLWDHDDWDSSVEVQQCIAGYSALDIITTVFKVLKSMDMSEVAKLDFLQQVSATHMRIIDGVGTLLQLQGLCAKLSGIARENKVVLPPIKGV